MTKPILHSLPMSDSSNAVSGAPHGDWETRVDFAHRLLASGNPAALDSFLALAAERPDDTDIARALMCAYEANVRPPTAPTPADTQIEAMALLAEGRRLSAQGWLDEAEGRFKAALDLAPDSIAALRDLAHVYLATRHSEPAIETARRILKADPNSVPARQILCAAYTNLGLAQPALAACREAIDIDPDCAPTRLQLGTLLRKMGRGNEAFGHIEAAAAALRTPQAYIELAAICRECGQTQRADAEIAKAHDLQPLTVTPSQSDVSAFTAVMLWAPGRANTPVGYLTEQADYERRMLSVVPDRPILAAELHAADVIVNLVADVDQGADLLPHIGASIDRSAKPVINHPRLILKTDRQAIAERLEGIPGCHMPRTVRCDRADLLAAASAHALFGIRYPLLLRSAGTHGGDAMEVIHAGDRIADFVQQFPAEAYYVTAFVDYRSPDGHFRKYRFIVVDGQIFPYHLAIGDDWKVHHYRTRMADHAWMQREEAAFLADPSGAFTPPHMAALRTIDEIVALDFFGVDCARDREGRLLIFEVNACMLVEPDDSHYAFKLPYNTAVRHAFARMLARAAAGRA